MLLFQLTHFITYFCYFYFRQALNEAKKQNHTLLERLQSIQNDLGDAEVRRAELDGQLRTSHKVLYENIDQILLNKLYGSMHYKIGVTCEYNGHGFYTQL